SGLDALVLALRAWGIGPGDEVIVPSNTYIATWLAASHVGARPVPVEPDEATYNIDPARIEAAITPRTRAIIPVHLYGQAADIAPGRAAGGARARAPAHARRLEPAARPHRSALPRAPARDPSHPSRRRAWQRAHVASLRRALAQPRRAQGRARHARRWKPHPL